MARNGMDHKNVSSSSNSSIDSSCLPDKMSIMDNEDYQTEASSMTYSRETSTRSSGDRGEKIRDGFGHHINRPGGRQDRDGSERLPGDICIERELNGEAWPPRYTYKALADATNNFSSTTIIGTGGSGHVYEGVLNGGGMRVAIKKLDQASSQGKQQYLSEIKILVKLRHPNVVRLDGWCHEEGALLLVYEFVANGDLSSHLHPDPGSRTPVLDWVRRYNIMLGLASALQYLHEEWAQCVLHRDITPTNIMLDSNFNPRLVDFGLAMLIDHGTIEVKAGIAGTPGYVAPEVVAEGRFGRKTDVYSFGVVALEVACGVSAVPSNYNLVEMAWDLYRNGMLLDCVDKRLEGSFDREQMERLMLVGLWCTLPDMESRPRIRQAKRVLDFEDPLPALFHSPPPLPGYPVPQTTSRALSSSGIDRMIPVSSGSMVPVSTGSSTSSFTHVMSRYFKMTESFASIRIGAKKKKKNAANAKRPSSPSKASVHEDETASIPETSEQGFHMGSPPNYMPTDPLQSYQVERGRDIDIGSPSNDKPAGPLQVNQIEQGRDFDIGIPPNYKPAGPLQAYQLEIIQAFTKGLSEIVRKQPQINEVMESVRRFTSLLVSFRAPLDDWSSLALYVLQAVKDIEDLKAELKVDDMDFDSTTATLFILRKEHDECTCTIEGDSADLTDSRHRLSTAQQQRVSLMAESVELQKRLANLRKRIKDTEDTCSILQESVTSAEERISAKAERIKWLGEAVASANEKFEMIELKRQEKSDSISTLITSMLSRISSFSCTA